MYVRGKETGGQGEARGPLWGWRGEGTRRQKTGDKINFSISPSFSSPSSPRPLTPLNCFSYEIIFFSTFALAAAHHVCSHSNQVISLTWVIYIIFVK